ncbi:MAG: hypothetical protein K2J32_11100, partial [Ruminococcus sp.]|nr:hypothetical protein [Ruminococcus sp.]
NLNNLIIKKSSEISSISIVKVTAGYALYNNALLDECEGCYDSMTEDKNTSIYLHLRPEWIDKMPSPNVEVSWQKPHTSRRTVETNKRNRAYFDRCYNAGNITINDGDSFATLTLADESVNLENSKLYGSLKEKTLQLESLKQQVWHNTCKTINLYGMGSYAKGSNPDKDAILKNIKENIVRDYEMCSIIAEQCKKLDKINDFTNEIKYPQYFAIALLCELIERKQYIGDIILKRQKVGDPQPPVVLINGNVESHNENDPDYYYVVYNAICPYFEEMVDNSRKWVELIQDTWKMITKQFVGDPNEKVRIQNIIFKYGNIFKYFQEEYRKQAERQIDLIQKKKIQSISDFYQSCFDSMSMLYNHIQ